MLLPNKYKAEQTKIVCKALGFFNPVRFKNLKPEDVETFGLDAGNMSYGFKVCIKGEEPLFLKFSKVLRSHKQLNEVQRMIKYATQREDGLVAATPIASDNDAIFVKLVDTNIGLPKEFEGLTVSLQTFVLGRSLREKGTDRKNMVKAARLTAQQLAKFHRLSETYQKQNPDRISVIPKGDHKQLRPKEDVIKETMQCMYIEPDKGIDKVVEGFSKKGTNPLKNFIKQNSVFIETQLKKIDKDLFEKYRKSSIGDQISAFQEQYPDRTSIHKKLVFLRHLLALINDAGKGKNGKLGKLLLAYKELEPQYDALFDLPRGIIQNDAHKGNFLLDGTCVAMLDFDDVVSNGFRVLDLGCLTQSFAFSKSKQQFSFSNSVAKEIVVAYHENYPLKEKELKHMMLCVGAHFYGFFPEFMSGIESLKEKFEAEELDVAPLYRSSSLPSAFDLIPVVISTAMSEECRPLEWVSQRALAPASLDAQANSQDKHLDKKANNWTEKAQIESNKTSQKF